MNYEAVLAQLSFLRLVVLCSVSNSPPSYYHRGRGARSDIGSGTFNDPRLLVPLE